MEISGNLDSRMRRIFVFVILHLAVTKVSADGVEDALSHLPPLMRHDEEIMSSEEPTTLTCEGTRPITWTYENYDGTTEHLGEGDAAIPQKDGYNYSSSLTIDIDYDRQGHYHCHYEDADVSNKNHSAGAYLYLFAFTENFGDFQYYPETITRKSGDNIHLDCRPSQPNLTIIVTRNGKVIHNGPLEDPRKGYVIKNANTTFGSIDKYECTLHTSDKFTYKHEFHVKVRGELESPWIFIQENTYNVVGYDMEVACRILDRNYTKRPKFSWTYPTNNQDRVTNETVHAVGLDNAWFYTSYLKIHNVSLEDSGDYECKVSVLEYHATKDNKTIKILEKKAPFVDVTPPLGNISLEAGKPFSLELKILYFPPEGLALQTSNSKFSLKLPEKDTYTFQLELEAVEPKDFGIHNLTFITKNGEASQPFLVNLTVESETEISLKRADETPILEHQSVTVVCTATGYPLENITWAYQLCPMGQCQESFVPVKTENLQTPRITYERPVKNKYISRLTFVATEDARVECRAGKEAKVEDLVILDYGRNYSFAYSENGHQSKTLHNVSSTVSVTETFQLGLICVASRFYFQSVELDHPLDKDENGIEYRHDRSPTDFSFMESLNISSLNKSHEGKYSCIATYRNGSKTLQQTMDLTVTDFIPVRFRSDSNMKPEGSEKNLMSRDSFEFNCLVTGTPPIEITWKKDDKPLPHFLDDDRSTKDIIEIRDLNSSVHSGHYECTASNRGGHLVSGSLTLAVQGDVGTKAVGITIGIVVPFFIALVVMIILLFRRVRRDILMRREHKKNFAFLFERGRPSELNPDCTADEQADLLPYDHKWEVSRERIHIGKILGSGAFGRVVKAEVSNLEPDVPMTTVAVKMCKSQEDASQVRALALELKIMLHLGKHLNIVNLLGAHTSMVSDGELWILVEYCRYGSLLSFLHRHRHLFVNVINPVTDTINLSGKEGDVSTSPFSPVPLRSPDKTNSPASPKSPAPLPPVSPTASEKECYNTTRTAISDVSAGDTKYPTSPHSPTSLPEEEDEKEGGGTTDAAPEGDGHKGSPPRIFRFDSSSRFGSSITKNVKMVENPAYHKVPGNEKQPSSPTTVEDSRGSVKKSLTGKKSLMAQDSQGNYFLYEKSTIPGVTSSFSTIDLVCWAWQVAEGMDYLTRRKVLHGDLAVRNLLLAEDNVIKISDFGLSRDIYKDEIYMKQTNELMPVKWMSIEAIRDRIFTIQSDVWAFGITMWELFSLGGTPYPGMKIDHEFCQTLLKGYRMEKPKHANHELYRIMLQCWNLDPKDRPDFRTLANILSQMLMPETTNHYNNKNDEYLVSNEERFKTETDYLEMMSAPDFRILTKDEIDHEENSSSYIEVHNNTDVAFHKQDDNPSLSLALDDSGYLPMSSTAGSPKGFDVFSPRNQSNGQVFTFEKETPDKLLGRGNRSPSHQFPEKELARESDSLHRRSSCRSPSRENEALNRIREERGHSVLSDDSNIPENEELLHSKEHEEANRDYVNLPNSKTYVSPPTPPCSSSSSSSEVALNQPQMDQVQYVNLQMVA